jgi:hypothetical protein
VKEKREGGEDGLVVWWSTRVCGRKGGMRMIWRVHPQNVSWDRKMVTSRMYRARCGSQSKISLIL